MTEPTWAGAFRTHAANLLDASKSPGMAVGLAHNGQLRYFESLGYRNREQQLPYTLDTVNGLGSIGKTFTCMAIMQLQEQGKLNVHDPVIRYLPEFRTPDPEATSAITLHHLMTHTSGLPGLPFLYWSLAPALMADRDLEGTSLRKLAESCPPLTTADELMAVMAEHSYRLLGAPGELISYSNEGYALLGAIIERVSGTSYQDYLNVRILRPAGMDRSLTDTAVAQGMADAATAYLALPDEDGLKVIPSPQRWQEPVFAPAGSCHNSTVRDMLRFLEIFRTGGTVDGVRLLQAASVQAMSHPHAKLPPHQHYGYGLFLRPDYKGMRLLGHGGNVKGVATWVWCAPEVGLTGVALANLDTAPANPVLTAAFHGAVGLAPDEEPFTYTAFDCPPEALDQYCGTYPSEEGPSDDLIVAIENGGLVMKVQSRSNPLRPVGRHVFTFQAGSRELPLTFLTDGNDVPFAVLQGVRARRKA